MSRMYEPMGVLPRIKDRVTVDTIMLDVLVALTPALVMGAFLFGFRVLVMAAVSVLSCMGFELLYCKWTKKPITIKDLSACVTGLLLSMSLPVTAPYWAPVLGGAFAIVVVKQFYGGLGKNFMNPALAGRMLLLSFPGMMTTWVNALDRQSVVGIDAVSTANSRYVIDAKSVMGLLALDLSKPISIVAYKDDADADRFFEAIKKFEA